MESLNTNLGNGHRLSNETIVQTNSEDSSSLSLVTPELKHVIEMLVAQQIDGDESELPEYKPNKPLHRRGKCCGSSNSIASRTSSRKNNGRKRKLHRRDGGHRWMSTVGNDNGPKDQQPSPCKVWAHQALNRVSTLDPLYTNNPCSTVDVQYMPSIREDDFVDLETMAYLPEETQSVYPDLNLGARRSRWEAVKILLNTLCETFGDLIVMLWNGAKGKLANLLNLLSDNIWQSVAERSGTPSPSDSHGTFSLLKPLQWLYEALQGLKVVAGGSWEKLISWFEDFTPIIANPFMGKLCKALAAISTLVIFKMLGRPVDVKETLLLVSSAFSWHQISWTNIGQVIVSCYDFVSQCIKHWGTPDFWTLLYPDTGLAKHHREVMELMPQMKYEFDRSILTGYVTKLRESRAFFVSQHKQNPKLTWVPRLLNQMSDCINSAKSHLADKSAVHQAFTVALVGPAETGKTSRSVILARHLGSMMGLYNPFVDADHPQSFDNNFCQLNNEDSFDDAYTAEPMAMLDDVCSLKGVALDQCPLRRPMQMANNIPVNSVQSAVERKSRLPFRVKLLFLNSNVEDFEVNEFLQDPHAFNRRVSLHIRAQRIRRDLPPSDDNMRFTASIAVATVTASGRPGSKWQPIPGYIDTDWPSIVKLVVERQKTHMKDQDEHVARLEAKIMCKHGLVEAYCEECESYHLDTLFQSVAQREDKSLSSPPVCEDRPSPRVNIPKVESDQDSNPDEDSRFQRAYNWLSHRWSKCVSTCSEANERLHVMTSTAFWESVWLVWGLYRLCLRIITFHRSKCEVWKILVALLLAKLLFGSFWTITICVVVWYASFKFVTEMDKAYWFPAVVIRGSGAFVSTDFMWGAAAAATMCVGYVCTRVRHQFISAAEVEEQKINAEPKPSVVRTDVAKPEEKSPMVSISVIPLEGVKRSPPTEYSDGSVMEAIFDALEEEEEKKDVDTEDVNVWRRPEAGYCRGPPESRTMETSDKWAELQKTALRVEARVLSGDEVSISRVQGWLVADHVVLVPAHLFEGGVQEWDICVKRWKDKRPTYQHCKISRHSIELVGGDCALMWSPNFPRTRKNRGALRLIPESQSLLRDDVMLAILGREGDWSIVNASMDVRTKIKTKHAEFEGILFKPRDKIDLVPGTCGMGVIKKGHLCGMLLASIPAKDLGAMEPLDNNMVRASLDKLLQRNTHCPVASTSVQLAEQICGREVYREGIHKLSHLNFLDGPLQHTPIGTSALAHGRFKTKVKKSIYHDKVHPLCKTGVVFGSPPAARQNRWQPMVNSRNRLATRTCSFSQDQLRAARDAFLHDRPVTKYRELTMLENLRGIQGHAYIDAVNMSTSSGPPTLNSKWNCVTVDKNGRPVDLIPEMRELFDVQCRQLEQGYTITLLFKTTLKDEVVKITKTKTRVFFSGSFLATLHVRRLFLSVAAHMLSNRLDFEMAIGANSHSSDWADIHDHVAEYGTDRMIAGDYGNFDLSHSSEAVYFALGVFIELARRGGATESQVLQMEMLARSLTNANVDFDGTWLEMSGWLPSGLSLTALVVSMLNSMYLRCAYALTTRKPLSTFRENVKVITFGDDHIAGVSEAVPEFNHMNLVKCFKKANLEYTDAQKRTDHVFEYESLYDVEFLKRMFVPVDGKMLAPLRFESLEKMLTWTCSDRGEHAIGAIRSLRMEAPHHQEEGLEFLREVESALADFELWGVPLLSLV